MPNTLAEKGGVAVSEDYDWFAIPLADADDEIGVVLQYVGLVGEDAVTYAYDEEVVDPPPGDDDAWDEWHEGYLDRAIEYMATTYVTKEWVRHANEHDDTGGWTLEDGYWISTDEDDPNAEPVWVLRF